MKLKKTLSMVLAVVLVGSMLASCGGEKTESGVETVTIWSVNSHSKDVYEKLINEFNAGEGKEKGIKIDYQIKEGDAITQSLEVALQNGEGPDMFTSGDIKKFAANGWIMPIEELPNGAEMIEENKDHFTYYDMYDGKHYAIPYSTTTQGLIYNKEMFKEAGIVDENGEPKLPETYDELVEVAKKLTDPAKKQYGIILPVKWSGWVSSDITSPMMSSVGHTGYDPKTGTYDYSGLAPIINAFLQMKEDGSVYPGAEGIDNDPARALFAAGNIGMKMGFSFDVGVLTDQFPAEIEWGVAPYPVVDPQNKYMQQMSVDTLFKINANATKHLSLETLQTVYDFFLSDEFTIETYKSGVSIPLNWDVVKDVELENPATGWKEFCEIVSISHNWNSEPEVDKSGIRAISDRIIEDVWSGKMSAEDMCKQMSDDMNKAVEAYKQNPDKEPMETFIIPDYDLKR